MSHEYQWGKSTAFKPQNFKKSGRGRGPEASGEAASKPKTLTLFYLFSNSDGGKGSLAESGMRMSGDGGEERTLTDTQVGVLIVTRAALRAAPVHCPDTPPVCSLIADPETQAHIW